MSEAQATRRTRSILGPPKPPQIAQNMRQAAARVRASNPELSEKMLAFLAEFESRIVPSVQISAHQEPSLRAKTFDVVGVVVFDRVGQGASASAEATQLRLGIAGSGAEVESTTQPAADFVQGGDASGGVGIAVDDSAATICSVTIPGDFAAVVTAMGWQPSSAGAYRDVDIRLGIENEAIADLGALTLARGSIGDPADVFEVLYPRATPRTLSIRGRNLSDRYPYVIWARLGGYYFPTKESAESVHALNRLEPSQ